MLDGPSVAEAFHQLGITHVVWIPDSELGTWEPALSQSPHFQLVRVCREGEAFAVAAGLLIGGKTPIVLIQCTGFFEAGDSLRNVLFDMGLPLFMIVGVRSYYLHQDGKTSDSCPVFTEPIVRAWKVPYVLLDRRHGAEDLASAIKQARTEKRAGMVLLAE